jgi:hypothetical protein
VTTAPTRITPDRLPQSWRAVVTPPAAITSRVGAHLRDLPAGVLGTAELQRLVTRVAADPEAWESLVVVDADQRRYRLAFEDHRVDIWVLSWMDGQGTGFHDHGTSAVALTAVRGAVVERHPTVGAQPTRRFLEPGSTRAGDAGYIHAGGHHDGVPAVTIHAYSPPLAEVGQVRATADGRVWREPQHGRQELLDHTIPGHLD